MSHSPTKHTSGLPETREYHYRDVHMNTAKNVTYGSQDIHMATAKGLGYGTDVRMNTARAGTTLRQNNFQLWERELLESVEVRRKSTVAQLCTCVVLMLVQCY
jgi:cell cycle protein kinase DBF2